MYIHADLLLEVHLVSYKEQQTVAIWLGRSAAGSNAQNASARVHYARRVAMC